jgi:hypothetical protein
MKPLLIFVYIIYVYLMHIITKIKLITHEFFTMHDMSQITKYKIIKAYWKLIYVIAKIIDALELLNLAIMKFKKY